MRTPPNSAIPHQSVEDREQLPHARPQRHLLGLARLKQPPVELLEDRIVASGDQRTHVEGRPNRRSPAPNLPLAAPRAGVAVEGGNAYQGREALGGERSQLRELGQERPGQDRPHPGDAAEQPLVAAPNLAVCDRLLEFAVGADELPLKPIHVGGYALGDRLGGHLEAVLLCHEHLQDLPPPGEDGLQSAHLFVGEDAGLRTHGGGEASQDLRVDLVGLGQAPGGLGEVSGLAGVDDRDRNPSGASGDGGGRGALVAAGGFQDYQLGPGLLQAADELVDALWVVGDAEGLAPREQANVQTPLGHVDAGVWWWWWPFSGLVVLMVVLLPLLMVGPALRIRACPTNEQRPRQTFGLLLFRGRARRPVLSGGLLAKSVDQGGVGLSRPHRPHSTTTNQDTRR